ncbi:hypothetical protein [Nitrospirillum viridazoti]|uniref:Uncharacterized protein n=1 Tax=Nitrospirillum amazonense TaxID=28077 RepID=A0A560HMV6_9PROT|nr:hypothetical protein [Nitrospirillum amazonense]TWB46624.1 hypothetical protein FBZ92_14515 [Nitrospirillum amazonense]
MAETLTVSHRWLRDDAMALLLSEASCDFGMLNQTPDPQKARALVAGLCLIRMSDNFRFAFEKELDTLRHTLGWGPFYSWMIMTKFQVTENPDEYPFSLTDREFGYYATKEFSGKIGDVQGIYKPPNFYNALAQDIVSFSFGVGVGMIATAFIPEAAGAAALSGAAFGTTAARAAVSSLAGTVTSHLMPGNSWAAARAGRLWPRYLSEYNRRMLR